MAKSVEESYMGNPPTPNYPPNKRDLIDLHESLKALVAGNVQAASALLADVTGIRDATALIATSKGSYTAATIAGAIAQGVADLAVGDTFAASALEVDYIGLYSIAAGPVATEIARVATERALEDVRKSVSAALLPELEIASDVQGSIFRRVTADGHMYIPDLDLSVQDEIEEFRTKISNSDAGYDTTDLLNMVDADDHVFLRIKSDGTLVAKGVGEGGGMAQDTGVELASERTHFNTPSLEAGVLLSRLATAGISPVAPCPDTLLPQAFSITANLTNAYAAAQPANRLVIDSPYFNDDEFVHPHIVEFPNGFRGFRYWLTINPYRNSNDIYENPFVYGSNDLENFTLLPDMPQPLGDYGPAPNYNADTAFFYNPLTGELGVMWLHVTDNVDTEVRARTSRDGVNWSDFFQILPKSPASVDRKVSPSLLYNPKDGFWYMYTQHLAPAYPTTNVAREVRVQRSRKITGPWSAATIIATSPESRPWHQEFRCVGDKVIGLLGNTFSGNFFLAQSTTDWMTFNTGTVPILTGNEASYKGSFLPVFNDDDEMALRLIWTSGRSHPSGVTRWNVYTAQTNFSAINGA